MAGAVISERITLAAKADPEYAYGMRQRAASEAAACLATEDLEIYLAELRSTVPLLLKRLVYLAPDLSTIGGIQGRTRKILAHAKERAVEYCAITIHRNGDLQPDSTYCWQDDPQRVLEVLGSWSPSNTVLSFPNNTLRILPIEVREAVERFPLIFFGSGQLSFLIQDSVAALDLDYSRSVKATRSIVFSELDQRTYQQFGLHGQILGFHPTEIRDMPPRAKQPKALQLGYIGRVDFPTKGTDKLVHAAQLTKDRNLPPLKLYTPDNPKNAPDLERFCKLLDGNQLSDFVEIVYNEHNLEVMFEHIDILLLPSNKDSFPNVVLEAFSFGVPVVGTHFAPGPSRLITHGETGFLLDDFSYYSLSSILDECSHEVLTRLAGNSYREHFNYSMDNYFELIESVGVEALHDFFGWNRRNVFPTMTAMNRHYDSMQTYRKRARKWRRRYESEREKREFVENTTRYKVGKILLDTPWTLRGILLRPYLLFRVVSAHLRRGRK